MLPRVSVSPCAVAHSPTATAETSAVLVTVTVVLADVVTVTGACDGVAVGVGEADAPRLPRANVTGVTVSSVPEIAVTVPITACPPKYCIRWPAAPLGKSLGNPLGIPLGRLPDRAVGQPLGIPLGYGPPPLPTR